MAERCIYADDFLDLFYVASAGQDKMFVKVVEQVVEDTPTADVVKVKHGEWKQGVPYVCSICGKPAPDEKNTSERYSCWTSPYCPNCGAKMDGGKKE